MPSPADAKTAEFVRRYWIDDGAQPKHERLTHAFMHAISDGFWPSGARLPAEQELVRATPCSLGTVQKAMKTLADADVVHRRRGSGTVVADIDRPLDEPWHMRFRERQAADGALLPVYARVVARTVSQAKGPWSAPLAQGAAGIVRLTRLMSIGDRFDVYNVFCARPDRFPELAEAPLSALNAENLKELMARNHRLIVHAVRQEMTFGRADDDICKAAGWRQGTHVSTLSAVGFDLMGTALYYQEYYIPPNDLTLLLGNATRP